MGVEVPAWVQTAIDSETGQRLKNILRLHLRQIPCAKAVIPSGRCLKRADYQSLGQDEDDDGAEKDDRRQAFSEGFGRTMVKVSMLTLVGITVMVLVRNGPLQPKGGETEHDEFKRESPVVMYIGALELLVCGACSHTAAMMYKRRRHALRHPAETTGRERERIIKVHLEKEPGREEQQLYGLCYRPTTDGLECLIVEAVRGGSLLDKWNGRAADPSPEEVLEAALGDSLGGPSGQEPASPRQPPRRVLPGAAILAVNDVTGDVGMMQLQLAKPKVTLWVRPDVLEVLNPPALEEDNAGSSSSRGVVGDADAGAAGSSGAADIAPTPTAMGRAEPEGCSLTSDSRPEGGPRCACIGLEDEEPQILTRWTVCGLVFGWVTMLPVLLVQPHEERPRQHLFRQYLLKPCVLVLPLSIVLWVVDGFGVLFDVEIMRPAFYFGVCHLVVPAVLVFYLIQMQAADEKLVLEQRKSRLEEAGCTVPVIVEDPAPTLLREFVTVNPVALVWLSGCAAIPLVIFNIFTPMQTERGKTAQGYVNVVYAPCIFLQVAFVYIVYHLRFVELPRFYLEGIGLLLSLPCFVVWSICLCCASHYGRADAAIVKAQRRARAKEALKKTPFGLPESSGGEASAAQEDLVECAEASAADWELVYSA